MKGKLFKFEKEINKKLVNIFDPVLPLNWLKGLSRPLLESELWLQVYLFDVRCGVKPDTTVFSYIAS